MCNHYRANARAIETWAVWTGYKPKLPPEPVQEELWPKRPGYIVRRDASELLIDVMTWGVPCQMKGAKGQPITKWVTNVRNLSSPFWKSMLKEPARRCLVPFTRFAEPKPGKCPETGRPNQHWFSLPGREVAAFAGIWRPTEHGDCYAFLTSEPNPLVAPLHPKAMPVVLHEEDYDGWLSGAYDDVCSLAAPFPSQLMEVA